MIRLPSRDRQSRKSSAQQTRAPRPGLPRINHTLAATLSVAAVALMAAGAVQLFGDPSAGGPRRIIALAPGSASAEAAPRVSFEDALAEDSYLDPMAAYIGEPGGEVHIGENGEVRIAMVETAEAAQARQAVRPLPRAPLAGMTQAGPLGPLPIIAADGRRAAQVYARPFTGDAQRPKIAIIVGGLGFNVRTTTQAIDELPPDVTLSFVPYANDLQAWIDRARARGHEVMLELPMEPFDPEADDTGPQTLLATAEASQNIQRLENLLSRGAGYFGVTNYQGARFATSAAASQPIVNQLRRRGLAFISTGIGQRTALSAEAQRAGLANTAADRIIDARREADAIDEQLLNLEALALQNGSAIGAGFAYPVTMVQVGDWAREIHSRGYTLAPASAVLAARARPR